MVDKIEVIAKINLHTEVSFAYRLMESGLSVIQNEKDPDLSYYLSSFYFAQGLERILKVIIVLNFYDEINKGNVSELNLRTDYGHDINKMISFVENLIKSDADFLKRPACLEDLNFIQTDPILNEYLKQLTDFGGSVRYLNLDHACGKEKTDTLYDLRNILDNVIIEKYPALVQKFRDNPGNPIYYNDLMHTLVQERIITIEKLLCALSRVFTLSYLKEFGRKFYPQINFFLNMRIFGKTKYSNRLD